MSGPGNPSAVGDTPGRPGRRDAVLVAGMHRSGTSATAHALATLGLQLPASPMGPADGNELGHWGESEVVYELQRELEAEAGTSWDDVLAGQADWLASEAAERWVPRMAAALEREFPGGAPFVFKDPRISRQVRLWFAACERIGADASVLVVVRNPLEVAASLEARDGFERAKGLMLWLRHNLEIELATRGLRRAFLSYDELFADWRVALRRVSAELAVDFPHWDEEAEQRLDEVIRPDQRHHRADTDDLNDDAEVGDWVKAAYGALVPGTSPDAHARADVLDRVAAELAEADLAYGPILAARQTEISGEREAHERTALALERAEGESVALRQKESILTERVGVLTIEAERVQALEALATRLDERRRRSFVTRLKQALMPKPRGWAGRLSDARQMAAWARGPVPRGRLTMVREALTIGRSPHFDGSWYLAQHPDVARAGMSPVLHYVRYGVDANFDPAPHFDAAAYRAEQPDLAPGADPLTHFLRSGDSIVATGAIARRGSAPGSAAFAELGVLGADEVVAARAALAGRPTSVSVVIPTHDRRDGVIAAIGSALGQTAAPMEVIVADDGSTDGTSEAIREAFRNEVESGVVRIARSEERSGSSAARNGGLALATGEIVAYLDSDNTWHPEYLEVMSATLAARSDVATAYCALSSFGDDGSPPETRFQEYDRNLLLTRNYVDLNSFVHRRRLVDQLGGFDEELTRLVDWDFVLRLTRNHPPITVRRALVNYYAGDRGDRVTNVEDFESNAAKVRSRFAHERLQRGQVPFRIAYVLWDWPALSQTFVLSEIRELIAAGYDVNVYFHTDPDRPAELDFEVPAHRVSDPEDLAGLLAAHGRTVIHSHFAYPAVTRLAWPAARIAGIPFTFMVHAVDVFHRLNDERNRIAEVASDELCARVFAIGNFHRSFLIERGVPAEKISIARPAARLAEASERVIAQRQDRERRVVACLSRFVAKKGVDDLIRVAASLPDVEVRLYGYGPQEEELRELASQLGTTNVDFRGPVSDEGSLADALAQADVFALPCRVDSEGDMDGLPTVIGEAMAAGVPVVTTPIAAIPDVIEHGVTGFLVPPDDPSALSAAIGDALVMDSRELGSIAGRAQQRARQTWNPEKTVDRLIEAWGRPPLDIVLVTYNRDEPQGADVTTEILRRVRSMTTSPYRLTIVDNFSDEPFREALEAEASGRDDTRLVLLDGNAKWGPAMNIAIDGAASEVVLYVCSREGFVLQPEWERAYLDHMDQNRDVAMAGHRLSSPGFADGSAYMHQGWFGGFRNKAFAEADPGRLFSHVQGGLFALRKAAYERCGRFSTVVSQDAVDVEFSYVVESMGWKLGEVPSAPSVTVKTRPRIGALIDEHTVAAHPLTLESVVWADDVVADRSAYCNVCTWSGSHASRNGTGLCPQCASTPLGRLVYRHVAATALPYRRLGVASNLADAAVEKELALMFEFGGRGSGALADRVSGASLVVADLAGEGAGSATELADAIKAGLDPGGIAVVGSSEPLATPDTLALIREQLAAGDVDVTSVELPGDSVAFAPSGVVVAERRRPQKSGA